RLHAIGLGIRCCGHIQSPIFTMSFRIRCRETEQTKPESYGRIVKTVLTPCADTASAHCIEHDEIIQLDAIVRAPKPVFVGFARFRDFGMCVVLLEVGGVPGLPSNHRMVRSS